MTSRVSVAAWVKAAWEVLVQHDTWWHCARRCLLGVWTA